MAARKSQTLSQNTRDRIKAAQLINRLTAHALEDLELSATQIKAIEILLKKVLPDLKAVELTGADGGAIKTDNLFRIEVVSADADNQDT